MVEFLGPLVISIGLLIFVVIQGAIDLREGRKIEGVLRHDLAITSAALAECQRLREVERRERVFAFPAGGRVLLPQQPRRLITRVKIDRPMDLGRWVDRVSEHETFKINAIRLVAHDHRWRQSLYAAGNKAVFFLPAITDGEWIKLTPICIEPKDQAQLFRLSDWSGPEFNVEFDLDVTIGG